MTDFNVNESQADRYMSCLVELSGDGMPAITYFVLVHPSQFNPKALGETS